MNPIRFFKKSILHKIIISFLLVMVLPTSAISISSYLVSVKILKEKVSDSFHENLLYIGSSIEKELSGIEKITDLIFINEDIQQAISSSNKNQLDYFANYKDWWGKVESYSVQTMDTTGAGDAFLGALLFEILEKGKPLQAWQEEELQEALLFANASGALATTRKGAIPSIGTIEEVHALMRDGNRTKG